MTVKISRTPWLLLFAAIAFVSFDLSQAAAQSGSRNSAPQSYAPAQNYAPPQNYAPTQNYAPSQTYSPAPSHNPSSTYAAPGSSTRSQQAPTQNYSGQGYPPAPFYGQPSYPAYRPVYGSRINNTHRSYPQGNFGFRQSYGGPCSGY